MKQPARLAAVAIALMETACEGKPPPPAEVTVQKETLSGKERAEDAAARVREVLERDLKSKGLEMGSPVFLRVFKEERLLELHVKNRDDGKFVLFRTYEIAAASGRLGPKLAEGDSQVPEGFYHVPRAAMKPDSDFHLAFNIGYPNEYDSAHGRTGSFIMVHGNCVSIGCLAMTDEKIEEIYTLCDAALRGGQRYFRVHIFPFRMTAERMEKAANSPHADFWNNLREGYDVFERYRVPPDATVAGGRYRFE